MTQIVLLKDQVDETGVMPTLVAGTIGTLLEEEVDGFYFLDFGTVVIQVHESEFEKVEP